LATSEEWRRFQSDTWQIPENCDVLATKFVPIQPTNFPSILLCRQNLVVAAVSLWFKTHKTARKLDPFCTTANANHSQFPGDSARETV
jgi:hypothetical protein